MSSTTARRSASLEDRANQRNAVLAGFLGWTLDAFDFFVLVFVLAPVAAEFHRPVRDIALTLGASLAMRPVGALIFGLIADRWGRRLPLMLDIIFYSVIEVLSGLAPNYTVFFILRGLYGIGMGGEWGVGASLAMESAPVARRGMLSGLLQEGYACGYLIAAVVYGTVFPHFGWRPLFFLGGLPALLVLFVRAKVKEPEAWKQSRTTDWSAYGAAIRRNWKRFAYLIVLMTMMNLISHGTQDLYPTFLGVQRRFSPHLVAAITAISMVGAILGGLAFGLLSDRRGRRLSMIVAVLLAAALIPLWVYSPGVALLAAGVFLMQFMVQGAWGVIPAHLNELSPGALRGFFPGFAYQIGVLFASSVEYVEAAMAEHLGYAGALALLAAIVLLAGAVVIAVGPEAHGASFVPDGPT
ncbi:MAG TPA: MFS transporter [Candidatus Acidoferrales bacterium]|nr:MFS transporter [Candidatus Acidoferrales bacterium]